MDLIGRGWKFPIKVSTTGGLSYSEGPERVQDAIWIVLSTALGERVMRPGFGAGISEYVFSPNSAVNRMALQTAVKEALVDWEPRIELVAVRVDASPYQDSQVLVSIDYRLKTTNELFNMVYPLYLGEGIG